VKRHQEIQKKRTYSRLSADCHLRIFTGHLDIVGVKCLKDIQKLFVAAGDFGAQDRRVQA
jgi:hypothetical protein